MVGHTVSIKPLIWWVGPFRNLRVDGIHMGGASIQEEEDDALGAGDDVRKFA